MKARNADSESTIAAKNSEIMALKNKSESISSELKKVQALIEDGRQSLAEKSAEAARLQDELQRAETSRKQAEEKLKAVQKELDMQRHNSESVKASLEKKLKDQVSTPGAVPLGQYPWGLCSSSADVTDLA